MLNMMPVAWPYKIEGQQGFHIIPRWYWQSWEVLASTFDGPCTKLFKVH